MVITLICFMNHTKIMILALKNIYNYLVEPKGIESRYILKGYNLDQCPDYHPGAGRPCWLFTDEIIIN